jgi:hypothetical protein
MPAQRQERGAHSKNLCSSLALGSANSSTLPATSNSGKWFTQNHYSKTG